MPGVQKPGVDWPTIRACWEAGQSAESLAQRFPVTRQAISWRVKEHGWKRTRDADALAATATAARISKPKNAKDRALLALDAKRTPAVMQRVLDALRTGKTRALAARMNGLTDSALRAWLVQDEAFAALAESAVAEFAGGQVDVIRGAAAKGDWRASLALLERHPETRDAFAPPGTTTLGANAGSISVKVVLPPALAAVLGRPWRKPEHAPPVIEHDGDTDA